VLAADPAIRVVGDAASGAEALDRIPGAGVDVVTLDLAMPGLDGLATLRKLLQSDPGVRVLMLSAHTKEGAEATIEALAAGAADFVDKSRFGLMEFDGLGRELIEKVKAVGHAGRATSPPASGGTSPGVLARCTGRFELCVIGASTGGPAAIEKILEALPADFPLPIAIVQHMPPGFTRPFAARLNRHCRLRVTEAANGDKLEPGLAVIGPAGYHFRVSPDLAAVLTSAPSGVRHVPSVDELMFSAAQVRPGRVLGILLTGMGDDGANGLTAIRAGGGVTVAESEATAVVYGMPRAASERGGVSALLPLPQIAALLASLTTSPRLALPGGGRAGASRPDR
jgi:two-component system chemotaxis response regulator CheB